MESSPSRSARIRSSALMECAAKPKIRGTSVKSAMTNGSKVMESALMGGRVWAIRTTARLYCRVDGHHHTSAVWHDHFGASLRDSDRVDGRHAAGRRPSPG